MPGDSRAAQIPNQKEARGFGSHGSARPARICAMSEAQHYRIAEYDSARHLEGCAEALRSAFSHNHWPAWQCASPRLARDFTASMAAVCDSNFVVEDAAGAARGQVFCMAPTTRAQVLRGMPRALSMTAQFLTGLYLPRPTALRHLYAFGRGMSGILRAHPTHDPHFEVMLFAIHESMQGKGWGRKLMDAAVARFAERGAARAVLVTDSTMSWRFYERYGYERTLSMPMGSAYKVAMDSGSEDAYVYELDVGAAAQRIARERAAREDPA